MKSKNKVSSANISDDVRLPQRLPIAALSVLSLAAFLTLLTEIMPAGLLSSIAQGLDVSESLAGQFITAYAVGALVAAIPVTALTQGIRRRALLLAAIFGFALVNLITAFSDNYTLSIVARFSAGIFGGIVWSLLAGYAVRMSPPKLSGRAIAISGAGATLALVLGVPLGSLLGRAVGWQGAFGLMSAIAVVLIIWIITIVPDFPGQPKEQRQSLVGIFLKSGICSVLFVVFSFVIAHNILYIYIEPFLAISHLSANVDIILLIFGIGSVIGLWLVGAIVDRQLQLLAIASIIAFALAALLLGLWGDLPKMVYPSILIWGLSFGGFATITQTALSRFAGDSIDVAQAMYTTGWNTAIACGGVVGGVFLDRAGPTSFPWIVICVLGISLCGVIFAMNKVLSSNIRGKL